MKFYNIKIKNKKYIVYCNDIIVEKYSNIYEKQKISISDLIEIIVNNENIKFAGLNTWINDTYLPKLNYQKLLQSIKKYNGDTDCISIFETNYSNWFYYLPNNKKLFNDIKSIINNYEKTEQNIRLLRIDIELNSEKAQRELLERYYCIINNYFQNKFKHGLKNPRNFLEYNQDYYSIEIKNKIIRHYFLTKKINEFKTIIKERKNEKFSNQQ